MNSKGSLISYFSSLAQKERGINFAQGRPGYSPPDGLLKILKDLSFENNLHQYAPGKGDFQLIEETKKIYKKIFSSIDGENILITLGATEGIALSFLFLLNKFKNFSVLSFEPFYESYPKILNVLKIPLFSISIDPFSLEWDKNKLKEIVLKNNVKGIILSSPGNPLGKVWKEGEICFLAEVNNLIFISSYSKTLSITGWRIGYIISNEETIKKISSIHDYTHLSAPYILQRAIALFLKKENVENYLKSLRKKINLSLNFINKRFNNTKFKVCKTEGGMFVWVEIPDKYKNSYDFASRLFLKKKVAVVPGINFSKKAKNFIRINLSLPFEEFKEGIERILIFDEES